MRTAQRVMAAIQYPEAWKPFLDYPRPRGQEDAGIGRLRDVSRFRGEPGFIHEDVRRIWNVDLLPQVRCYMIGRGWQRHFGVEQRPLEEVRPPWFDRVREGRRWVLCFSLEEDVRELVTNGGWSHERFDEVRPGVFAMWSD